MQQPLAEVALTCSELLGTMLILTEALVEGEELYLGLVGDEIRGSSRHEVLNIILIA